MAVNTKPKSDASAKTKGRICPDSVLIARERFRAATKLWKCSCLVHCPWFSSNSPRWDESIFRLNNIQREREGNALILPIAWRVENALFANILCEWNTA